MPENDRKYLLIDEACAMCRVGKNTMYRLLKNGDIQSKKVAKKYIIPKQAIVDYMESDMRFSN